MAKNQIVIFYLSIFSYAVRFLEESAHTGKLSANTMVKHSKERVYSNFEKYIYKTNSNVTCSIFIMGCQEQKV